MPQDPIKTPFSWMIGPSAATAIALTILAGTNVPIEPASAALQVALHSQVNVLSLMEQSRMQVERQLGRPEQVTPYQTVYNLPGQERLQWLFYQREGILVGVGETDKVKALLFLPTFKRTLNGGIKLGMKRSEVTATLGAADHVVPDDTNTERRIYLRHGYDLTFDVKQDRLVQALYYPVLKSVSGQKPASKAPSARPSTSPSLKPTPNATSTPGASPSVPTISLPTQPRAKLVPLPSPSPTQLLHSPSPAPVSPSPKASPIQASHHPSAVPAPSSPTPLNVPTHRPTPGPVHTPTASPTNKPSQVKATPTARPSAKPTPKPKPSPTPKPTPKPCPSTRVSVTNPTSNLLPLANKSGSASIVGLVSYFRSESGEIAYLRGAQFYLSRTAIISGPVQGLSRSKAAAMRGEHRGKIWEFIKGGKIASGTESDRFGRFKMESLPEGEYYLVGFADEFGRYMVWQRKVQLNRGTQLRLYFNRNNADVLTN